MKALVQRLRAETGLSAGFRLSGRLSFRMGRYVEIIPLFVPQSFNLLLNFLFTSSDPFCRNYTENGSRAAVSSLPWDEQIPACLCLDRRSSDWRPCPALYWHPKRQLPHIMGQEEAFHGSWRCSNCCVAACSGLGPRNSRRDPGNLRSRLSFDRKNDNYCRSNDSYVLP